MKNRNALYALAYIQETENPYIVFCNLIQYVLHISKNQELPEKEIADTIFNKFEIKVPRSIIKISCGILRAEKVIEISKVYKLINCTLNINEFEKQMSQLRNEETILLSSIKDFLKYTYSEEWDTERIRNALSNLLMVCEYSVPISLFSNNEIELIPVKYSDEYFIKRYIQYVIAQKDDCYQHLLQIVKGVIIINGITQSDNGQKSRKSDGTRFFLDTKLVLRYLGFSNTANINAAKETVKLIKESYKGKLCVIERTVDEIKSALQKASEETKSGCFSDIEMYWFSIEKDYSSTDFSISAESIEILLTQNGIEIEKRNEWNEKVIQKHTIDTELLVKFISEMFPKWKLQSIQNDVYNINQINIMRRSNYSIRYGGDEKLPIFVTTNNALVEAVKAYAKQIVCEGKSCAFTERMAPVITADGLTCSLWTNHSLNLDLPLIRLSQIAYSAHQTDRLLFEKINSKAKNLEQKHYGCILGIDERRREKLNDLIFKYSNKGEQDITEQIVADSFDELLQMELKDKNERIDVLEDAVKQKEEKEEEDKKKIVEIASSKYINKFGFGLRLKIIVLRGWWLIIDLIIALAAVLINVFVDGIVKQSFFISIILPVFLAIVPIIVNYIKDRKLMKSMFLKQEDKCKCLYTKRIEKLMTSAEIEYKDEIINLCKNKSKFLI